MRRWPFYWAFFKVGKSSVGISVKKSAKDLDGFNRRGLFISEPTRKNCTYYQLVIDPLLLNQTTNHLRKLIESIPPFAMVQTEGLSAIVQAPAPDQVLPKSIAGAGLLTQIIIAKYVDHLPLYRQQQMFLRDFGYDVSSSTLGDWFAGSCTTLEPLYIALIKQVLEATYLQGDESRIGVLEKGDDKKKDKSHRLP